MRFVPPLIIAATQLLPRYRHADFIFATAAAAARVDATPFSPAPAQRTALLHFAFAAVFAFFRRQPRRQCAAHTFMFCFAAAAFDFRDAACRRRRMSSRRVLRYRQPPFSMISSAAVFADADSRAISGFLRHAAASRRRRHSHAPPFTAPLIIDSHCAMH